MADNSDSDSDFESQHTTLHGYKQILRPLSTAERPDLDNWPSFMLEDARIYDKQGKLASILDVGLRGPFTATGRLSFDGDDGTTRARLINKRFRDGSRIKIANLTQYSFGSRSTSSDSAHIVLWGGETEYGWFEIAPAADYEPFYAGDLQSIGILYFFQGLYKRKGAKEMAIEDLLLKYTAREGSGATRGEMEARIKSHADFLIRQIVLKEDGDITKTVFYSWLANERPDVVTDLIKRNTTIVPFVPTPKTKTVRIADPPNLFHHTPAVEPHEPGPDDIQDYGPEEHNSNDASNDLIFIKGSSDELIDDSYPVKPPNTDIPGVIIYLMELNRLGRGKKEFRGVDKATFSMVSGYLYLECSFATHQWGHYLMLIHRNSVLARLPPAWQNSLFHRELIETSFAKVNSNMKGLPSEKIQWQAEAEVLGELNLRKPLGAPRHRVGMGPKSKAKPSSFTPQGAGGGIRNTPVARAVASSRTSNNTSRQNTPPTAAISSRRQPLPNPQASTFRRRKSTPPAAIPSGRAAIAAREAEKRIKLTSGESNTPVPPPTGKKPTRTIIFSTEKDNSKHMDAMDLDSPEPEEDEEEELKPVFIGITKRYLEGSPTATVAVVSAESKKTGHKVEFLTERVLGMGRERVVEEQEFIGGRVVPRTVRRAMLD